MSSEAGPVRIALRRDVAEGARILVEAFQDDPWFSWLFPDPASRREPAGEWFALVLDRAFTMGHTYRADHGFANWIAPDVHFPRPEDIDLAVDLLRRHIGERASTALAIIREAGSVFPDSPRFHCVYVGVHPGHQGKGVGGSLLRRVLDVCDNEGLAASLNSTNDINLPFYRGLGFEEIGEVPIADSGSVMRPMLRRAP
jgi:GNAT superfamily N-acetyltransferase